MNEQEIDQFAGLLNNSNPSPNHKIVYQGEWKRLKCFSTLGDLVGSDENGNYEWRYPLIDIQFMIFKPNDMADGVDIVDPGYIGYKYPLDYIFPLRKTSFENFNAFVPFDVEAVLKANYNLEKCRSNSGLLLFFFLGFSSIFLFLFAISRIFPSSRWSTNKYNRSSMQ